MSVEFYIISGIVIASNAIVGVILYHRIKSQNEIIENLKTYNSIIDINKIKEFQELKEEALIAAVNLEIDKFIHDTGNSLRIQFDEMATFVAEFLYTIPEDVRKEIIDKNLPNCRKVFAPIYGDNSDEQIDNRPKKRGQSSPKK